MHVRLWGPEDPGLGIEIDEPAAPNIIQAGDYSSHGCSSGRRAHRQLVASRWPSSPPRVSLDVEITIALQSAI
jgi:hypothetical protein